MHKSICRTKVQISHSHFQLYCYFLFVDDMVANTTVNSLIFFLTTISCPLYFLCSFKMDNMLAIINYLIKKRFRIRVRELVPNSLSTCQRNTGVHSRSPPSAQFVSSNPTYVKLNCEWQNIHILLVGTGEGALTSCRLCFKSLE